MPMIWAPFLAEFDADVEWHPAIEPGHANAALKP
jgi:hypothetical protein